MLFGLLPLLRGWMYIHRVATGTLRIGEEKRIDLVEAPGLMIAVAGILSGSLDAKHVHIHVEIDGPEKAYPVDFTMYSTKYFGATLPVNWGGFLTVYDDTEKRYAGAIAPSNPIPFSRRFEIKLIPPAQPVEESEAKPISYWALYDLVKIIDIEEFKASLREILS